MLYYITSLHYDETHRLSVQVGCINNRLSDVADVRCQGSCQTMSASSFVSETRSTVDPSVDDVSFSIPKSSQTHNFRRVLLQSSQAREGSATRCCGSDERVRGRGQLSPTGQRDDHSTAETIKVTSGHRDTPSPSEISSLLRLLLSDLHLNKVRVTLTDLRAAACWESELGLIPWEDGVPQPPQNTRPPGKLIYPPSQVSMR